ncbi:MarR family transcriptional regulator [Glycomyces tarimensis]
MSEGNAAAETRARRRQAVEVTDRLRELTVQLSLLNHQVSRAIKLQDVDLDCLDIIARAGPLTPSSLARQTGLHPATMTGVLDRLEKAGWVRREKVPADRRAVHVTFVPDRVGEILDLYRPMLGAVGAICEDFTDAELAAIAAFVHRTTEAGREATAELSGD